MLLNKIFPWSKKSKRHSNASTNNNALSTSDLTERLINEPTSSSDWKQFSFSDFTWTESVLWPASFSLAGNLLPIEGKALPVEDYSIKLNRNKLLLSMKSGKGKISDAGYDQCTCYYTSIPADSSVIFSADLYVKTLPKGSFPTFQEGFGLFLRDTVLPDPDTGYHYSNMAAVGGYYGSCNFFGHSGITKESIEHTAMFSRFAKPGNDFSGYGISTHETYHMTIALLGASIRADIKDSSGKHLLYDSLNDETCCLLRIQENMFRERDHESLYLGFFTANGYEICIDIETVQILSKPAQSVRVPESILHVSPLGTPAGNGSREQPYDFLTALLQGSDGYEILLQPGRYCPGDDIRITKAMSGTPSHHRRLAAAPNAGYPSASEPEADNPANPLAETISERFTYTRPIIDFENSTHALLLEGNYWELEGIDVTGGHGICIQGSHNIVHKCRSYHNLETGFLLRHPDINSDQSDWPCDNLVTDCISCCNADPSEHNADGFACKIAAGANNRLENCLSFMNADDGFDLFAKNRKIGAVTLVNCKAHLNGYKLSSAGKLIPYAGNGNGFKLGGSGLAIHHIADGCVALGNKKSGFTSNSNPCMHLVSCSSYNNHSLNIDFYYYGNHALPDRIIEHCLSGSDPDYRAEEHARTLLKEVFTDEE